MKARCHQVQERFFHCAGALLHQQFANGSGAGKRKFGNPGVLREPLRFLDCPARDHIENASRKAGTLRQLQRARASGVAGSVL